MHTRWKPLIAYCTVHGLDDAQQQLNSHQRALLFFEKVVARSFDHFNLDGKIGGRNFILAKDPGHPNTERVYETWAPIKDLNADPLEVLEASVTSEQQRQALQQIVHRHGLQTIATCRIEPVKINGQCILVVTMDSPRHSCVKHYEVLRNRIQVGEDGALTAIFPYSFKKIKK